MAEETNKTIDFSNVNETIAVEETSKISEAIDAEEATEIAPAIVPVSEIDIRNLIYTIRGVQTMLDSDLAMLYGVETRTLNQAVKRNPNRFPERFCFTLTKKEEETLKSQLPFFVP